MYLQADPVVKTVLIILVIASVINLTVFLAKNFELWLAGRRQRAALAAVTESRSLAEAGERLRMSRAAATELIDAADSELRLSADALADREGLKERVASRLERIEAATARRISAGTGALASIGATAPFVGLFGTVWGIMNGFIGIAQAHTTNLAVIAPGIAEALLSTALGLVAAIPAVIIYNHFVRRIAAYKASVADTGSAVLQLVSRDLSRGVAGDTSHRQAAG
ncbi:MAG: tonB-system energizer ExbB [Salinisphaera sp.]|nr:tonB-system energizer ExbB [Salinisphaera sp.]